ncbi:hypothetical protein Srot_0363 [Segniliparus rotundus DSM 44985]|uniref:Uncharacterized protein n=1 Tax=Segniliparus rotundus (strain ATCC BAA-972 / CDC 1076 / CIP 108378 / DSM 44985 / JCM 13578) TaxID=640132 RepID=D6ZB91_SEGRD|nr:hypothetical protein [Segniliparus rotundus]ADG96850.1 hypothetical protein Srot_0363 [Segniliparus rotundus DSM 44985]
MRVFRADTMPPWWLGALSALGLGAAVASADFPMSRRERFLARAARIAGSAACAGAGAEQLRRAASLPPPIPISQRAGAAIACAASLSTTPLIGERCVDKAARALSARGASWPRARLGALIAATALLGELLQRFPAPPTPKTPPPRRRLVRPNPGTIIRN